MSRCFPPRPTLALLPLLCAGLGVAAAPAAGPRPPERRAVLFYTGAVHGTLEPCGCTSDPLGDVSRMTALVRREQKESAGAVLLVDAGNLSYPAADLPPGKRDAADLRAGFLAQELTRLPFGGSALGEADLAAGPGKVRPRRLAANLREGAPFVEPGRVHEVGGVRVGVLGLADPAAARAHGLRVEDPVAAARREAERLRAAGAEVVVALAPLERPQARQVARGAPVDFVVLGRNVGGGLARPERVGSATIVAAAEELQKVGRIEIVLRPDGRGQPLVDAGGAEAARLRAAEIDRALGELEAQLGRWEKDPAADRAFVARKRAERDELRAERARTGGAAGAWKPPAAGSYFISELVPLRRALPQDRELVQAMRRLDRQIGAANLRHAKPPPTAEPGRAKYVGDRACVKCHRPEMAFWKTTVHAKAWKTLVDGGKQAHDDCVSCHVTGYGEVGGSSLGFTKALEDVQCETCHGPGSIHVAEEGLEEPPAVRLKTPESECVRCHNEKHSDTFDYVAYLRDVLGKGHGEEARKKLGPGPTGRELRRAAMAKAKAAGEAQKKRL